MERRKDPIVEKAIKALGLKTEVEELNNMTNKLVPLEAKFVLDACAELTDKISTLGTKDRIVLALNVVKAYITVYDLYVKNFSLEKVKELFTKVPKPDAM